MKNREIETIIHEQLKKPTLAVLTQFLEVHSVRQLDGQPVITRVSRSADQTIAYLAVEGERFHLALVIDENTKKVIGSYSEPYTRICFKAVSETLTGEQLQSLTTLTSTERWSKGERSERGIIYSVSGLIFELPNEPDTFESKLNLLLTHLETDLSSITKLGKSAECSVVVSMSFHNENGMLGGPTLSVSAIKRLASLNLSLSFDLYAEGKQLK